MIHHLLVFLGLVAALPAAAASTVTNAHATVSLTAEQASAKPGGTVTLGIRLAARPGWHTYWKNPGESGTENRYAWTLPAGATVGEVRYPAPQRLVISGIMNYVFEGEPLLLADVSVPEGVTGTFASALKLDYLICSAELCVPERAELTISLPTGDGAADPANAKPFADARAALPKPVSADARFERKGDAFRLGVKIAAPAAGAYFFPETDGALSYSAPQRVGRSGEWLVVETKAGTEVGLKRVAGVLVIPGGFAGGTSFALSAEPGAVPAIESGDRVFTALGPPGAAAPDAGEAGIGFGLALVLAVAGGLLLNVMPCVFPILSLKALSLARSGETGTRQARREALAYTGGVVLAVTALGAAVLGLRAGGAAIGWAFQLQDPRVILLLLLLMTAIALNLAGLFEVRLGAVGGDGLAARDGTGGAFWTGVLAAAVATPCTGPFMGVALGAALVLPPVQALTIFVGLGLGLALPFLLLGYIPALRRRLPKPGAWMERFRRVLSVPMFLTAAALAWVLGRQAGVEGMTLGLLAAIGLGTMLWWFGARQQRGGSGALPLGLGAAAAIAAALTVTPLPPATSDGSARTEGPLAAKPFTPAALAAAKGKPVFVYFTADWCITCKVNERGALADPAVRTAFQARGVTILVGDWTRGDPVITRYLASKGRSGVPLYLYVAPDGTERVLPQILTVSELTKLTA
ncbi:MAG: protein-disulfide reductase DsbD family protein [Sphingomonadaceae bacterium]|nr:protein-disulfide reductase DsbD family protein [Sphingomonadaceae bacterium]